MTNDSPPNRLIHETSPYLLQHAHNPVDWHPWNPAALERARRENRLILLSIGYSACHWCHVMERESFENPRVAAIMNEHFVCIKVDREERPDLDKIYQIAHQLMTRRPGGWPLTVFLTPDSHVPVFAGTYFPPESRYGMPSFTEVLQRIAAHYRSHGDNLEDHVRAFRDTFDRLEQATPVAGDAIDIGPAHAAVSELSAIYDEEFGGFGDAPKFPHPTNVERMLRYWWYQSRTGEAAEAALHTVHHTLRAMADGGLYDQLGGGFYRYCVDRRWTIPHFEKMLYDNAQLLPLYADAYRATGDERLATIARETADWVAREMQCADGGYFSTLDADSEGKEGKYYVWSQEEVRRRLAAPEWAVTSRHYGLLEPPNFEGLWHLAVRTPLADVASSLSMSPRQAESVLRSARAKLLSVREGRIRPSRDEKILTSWNGMMVAGMARTGLAIGCDNYLRSAQRAMAFVRQTMWRQQRLLATARDGRAHLNAYLDDYAWLIEAALELLQWRWRAEDLTFAMTLADTLLAHFENTAQGGFFFTSDDHETLLHRHQPVTDDAIPSGNGVAAAALQRLGHLLGEQRYLDAAERTLRHAFETISRHPAACGSLLRALDERLNPPQMIVLRGPEGEMGEWREICSAGYHPARIVVAIPSDVDDLPGLLAERLPRARITAYICEGYTCLAPVTSPTQLHAAMRPARKASPNSAV